MNIFPRISLTILMVVLFVALSGCKPSTEAEYPYERQPLQFIASVSAEGVTATESTVQTPLASPTPSEEVLGPISPQVEGETEVIAVDPVEEVVVEEPALEVAHLPLETFHEARGKVIQARDEPGQHEFRFHPTGFFNYRYAGENENEVKRRGTYQLEGDSLLLYYTETRSKTSEETGLAAVQILRGQSVALPVRLPGDGSLHLGPLRYVAIN
jgi:hypothetical protein